MRKINRVFTTLGVTLLLLTNLEAQNSPFSKTGVGNLATDAFVHQMAMGGVGISNTQPYYINIMNPALLARNKNMIFEAGLSATTNFIQSGNVNQTDFSAKPNYLAFAFPITRNWTSGLYVKPFSEIDYSTSFSGFVLDEQGNPSNFEANYDYTSSGGLNTLNITNAFNLTPNLYFGLNASFLFGNFTDETSINVNTGQNNQKTHYLRRTSIADFLFKAGLAYRHKYKEDHFVNLGATYQFARGLNAKQFSVLERTSQLDVPILTDTLLNDQRGAVYIPHQFELGISWEKQFKWMVGADFSFQQWEDFRNFEQNDQLKNAYSIQLGASYTPDYLSTKNYLKRVTYSTGFQYQNTYLEVNEEQLVDLGINFGVSLPLGRGLSRFNFAFKLGQKGNSDEIEEKYIRSQFGITINDFSWFVKRKIN